jgi:cytochrome P450
LELLPDWRGLRSVRHILYSRGRAPGRSLDDSISELDDVVRNVITARRRSPAEQPNLVSICIAARDKETGEGMSDQQIRDQVLTFLLAGHETTATALIWSALELAWNPEVAGRLRAELDSILQGRTPTYSDLPQLKYTRAVFEESMRAHPPVWRISRTALEDDEVAGFRVPKGSTVVISPLLLHHNPSLWSHPERFRPDRFLKSANADQEARSRFTYIPFGAGPRMCVGYHFATIEATIILASYCQRFRFKVDAGFRPALDPRVTLRIQDEVTMLLEEAHAR